MGGFRKLRRFTLGVGEGLEREIEEEIAFHLETSRRELMARGLSAAEAEDEAGRRFGDLARYRRQCREIERRRSRNQKRGEIMNAWWTDVKVALRGLAKSRSFLFGTVLTLALGIGGATAIFSVVYGVLLRPLPFPESDRLVQLWEKNPIRGWDENSSAPANFLDWKEKVESFAGVTAYTYAPVDIILAGDGEPEILAAQQVYGNFFSVLGVEPRLGRGLREEESWLGKTGVAVISEALWRRRFGADPEIIGQRVNLSERSIEIVGVAPASFRFPHPEVDVWVPTSWEPEVRDEVWFRRAHFIWPVARLAPEVSLETAAAELEVVAGALSEEYPETNTEMGAGLTPLHEWMVGEIRPVLLLLLISVGLVLAIACVNVAHLQRARAAPRRVEIRTRVALGASRWRLLRQALVEGLLLALLGGGLGLLLALGLQRFLLVLAPEDLPRLDEISLSSPVLLFALAVTLLTGLLFGLAPALGGGSSSVEGVTRSRVGGERGGARTRRMLLAAEIGIALVLVIGTGLLGRSLLHLSRIDPGFNPEGVLTVKLTLPSSRYATDADVEAFFDQLVTGAEALGEVREVALADALPLTGEGWTSDFSVEGRPPGEHGVEVHHRSVGPGYFRTVGVPLVAGREFGPEDRGEALPAILINETLARRYFANEDPLGQRIAFDRDPSPDSRWRTIVGVVGDERVEGLASTPPAAIFEPLAQNLAHTSYLIVRSEGPPLALVGAIRDRVRALDAGVPLVEVRTLEDVVSFSMVNERFLTLLLGFFSALAVALAVVGIYGVIAYGVSRRRREIGIRMALGAGWETVVHMMLREGVRAALLGVGGGVVAALLLTRFLESQLFEVQARDPVTFVAMVLLLSAVALVASYLPARRAARIDPAITLREE